MNIFYVSLEFLHYKNKKSINIFLSNMEQERFLKVYGKTKAKNIVLRPKLIDRFYNHKNSLLKRGNNLLIVSHNFLLKGGKEINQLSEKFQNHKFFIIGNNRGARNSQNIIKLGKQDISSFSLEKFHFFIYPSKLDSHSFALEEAFINGLIPLTSSNVGFSEYLSKYKYIDKYLINNKNDWNQFFEKIIDLEEKEFDILSNELFFARKDWMQRDIKSEYLTNKII
jgi:glycosyltransferase involved in cell wall biosynthesis